MWNIKKVISKGDYLYALVPEHPDATKNGYVLLHRVIIENHLGRLLNANEIVHHINKDKKDNSIKNLRVMNNRKHCQMHALRQGKMYVRLKCPYCNKEFELLRNKSFLVKHTKYNCNCCSNYCKGRFFRDVQLFGLTHKTESAISENLLAEYKVYIDEDNSEETCL